MSTELFKDLVTVSEAARLLGITRQGVNDLIRRDVLKPAVTALGRKGLNRDDVRAYKKLRQSRSGRKKAS